MRTDHNPPARNANVMGICAYEWNIETGEYRWHKGAQSLLGPVPDAGEFTSLGHMLHAEDLPAMTLAIEGARRRNESFCFEARLCRTDGQVRWVECRGSIEISTVGPGIWAVASIIDTHDRRSRELEIHRQLESYRAIFDSLPERIWARDTEGRYTMVNHAYLEFAGIAREVLLGQNRNPSYPPQRFRRAANDFDRVLKTGMRMRHESVLTAPNGQKRVFDVSRSPIHDADGKITGVLGFSHDITEHETLKDSLAATLHELETLLATCPIGICIVRNRIIERCNPAAAAMIGYQPHELMGKSTRILYSDDESWRAAGPQIYATRDRPEIRSNEMQFARKDGSKVWILLITRIIDAAMHYAVSTWVDISEQRKLSQALIDARDAADAANRAKSAFLAHMSHEIRTPMHGVLGMLELLDSDELSAAQRETVHASRESAQALMGLMDGVLDFSRIEAGQLDIRPEPFDVRELTEQCTTLFRDMASKRGIVLDLGIDPRIAPALAGDSLRIRQIINNLLSNAVKFTQQGLITVRVRLTSQTLESQTLGIEVCDTGIGIEPSARAKLFQPFSQADAGTMRRFGGSGLGLSISKRLAEAMGGTLALESVPAKGTSVTLNLRLPIVTIKVASTGQHEIKSKLETSPRLNGPRVLVVEDHPINLKLIVRQLNQLGFAADVAINGAQALQLWHSGRYAAVITDCHMPVMDGFALAREIRNMGGAGKNVPILACTASALSEEAEQCRAAGMNDVMVKPVTIAALRARLQQWVPENGPTN